MKNILYILLTCALFLSCAQFVPPTGGPKDETPPKVIAKYPENETLSFKEKIVTLEFDELIDANSLRQELIITPQPEGSYDLKIKPYGIEIKFDKAFKDSTTYTLNFRNGIKDLNEKNPAENLKVVFSTGTEIDSLKLKGAVRKLWTKEKADEVLVGLYDINTKDSLPLLKRKPNYFFKTDTSGTYNFENIKASKYRIIGFTDSNLNLIFDSKKEEFGFIPDTINLYSNIDSLDFEIYKNNREVPKVKRKLSRSTNYSVSFDKDIKTLELNYLNDNDSLTYQIRDKELLFYNNPVNLDTVQTKIIVSDSIGNILIDTIDVTFSNRISRNEPQIEQLTIKSNKIKNNSTIKLPLEYILDFEYPIAEIDTSKISILSDTTFSEPFKMEWLDKSQTKLKVKIEPKATWKIQLTLEKGAITNYKSDTNDTYQLINKVYQHKDFGSISGQYNNFKGQKIAQLLDARSLEVIEQQIFTEEYKFIETLPGNYRIRVIEDSNENKQWDTADFENNILPEKVVISSGSIKLKANFELTDIVIK